MGLVVGLYSVIGGVILGLLLAAVFARRSESFGSGLVNFLGAAWLTVPALAATPSRLDGEPRLRERPLEELVEALRRLGARVEARHVAQVVQQARRRAVVEIDVSRCRHAKVRQKRGCGIGIQPSQNAFYQLAMSDLERSKALRSSLEREKRPGGDISCSVPDNVFNTNSPLRRMPSTNA